MIAQAEAVIDGQLPVNFPLVLCIPLEERNLKIGERTRTRLRVAVEIADERVGIGVARVSKRGSKAAAGAEVECPGPVSTWRFTVPHVLKICPKLITVSAANDREVIGERGEHIVVAYFSPAIEPVDLSRSYALHAAPTCNSWDRSKLIVFGEELGRRVVQCAPLQAADLASGRYEPLRVMTHANSCLIDECRTEDVNPVERKTIILVQIMRLEAPP